MSRPLFFWTLFGVLLYNFFQLGAGEFLVLGSMFLLWVLLPDEVHLAEASCSNPPCVGDIIDLVHISEWLDAEMASLYHSIGSHRRFTEWCNWIKAKCHNLALHHYIYKSFPKSPKNCCSYIFLHLFEYFPWWHDDDDFTIHLMKNRSNDSDWSESSPISNKLQTMKLLSHICNSCLMTQWYIDSHVLVPSSADSLALLSVISVCWTVIQHSPDQGGPR